MYRKTGLNSISSRVDTICYSYNIQRHEIGYVDAIQMDSRLKNVSDDVNENEKEKKIHKFSWKY